MKVVLIDNIHDPKPIYDKHMPFLKDWEWVHLKPNIHSSQDYNRFITSLDFWRSLECEWALIVQHDSGILREGIEEFIDLNYSYYGAPIKHIPYPAMNGGFSLRKVDHQIECLLNYNYDGRHNEDIYFSYTLQKLGFSLPPIEIAKKFSVETIFSLGSLGYHAHNKYLPKYQVDQVLNQYK